MSGTRSLRGTAWSWWTYDLRMRAEHRQFDVLTGGQSVGYRVLT